MQAIKRRVKHMLSKAVEPQIVELKNKLDRIERIVSTPATPWPHSTVGAIWRGGIGGMAVDAGGRESQAMTAKYRDELAFWHHSIKHDPVSAFHGPYEEVYGGWQRGRLEELREFLGLATWSDLEAWAADRSAIEIGPGPYPSISLLRWKRGVAVDPLVDAYVAEDLLPKKGHCDKLVFLASAAERMPLPGDSFDIMVAENCLDHVDDPGAVVAEVKRVLAPGGHFWLLVDLMEYRDHMHPNPFSERSLVALLTRHGFEIVRHRVNDHKSHPNAYGEFRGLLRKPRG